MKDTKALLFLVLGLASSCGGSATLLQSIDGGGGTESGTVDSGAPSDSSVADERTLPDRGGAPPDSGSGGQPDSTATGSDSGANTGGPLCYGADGSTPDWVTNTDTCGDDGGGCPVGTICVEMFGGCCPRFLGCAPIPSSCAGTPTCGCMGCVCGTSPTDACMGDIQNVFECSNGTP
jgi:hypothetical protein